MEGLPVRQWRKSTATVITAAPRDPTNAKDNRNSTWQELPMPRGSELYSPMSQALLRAARMGQVSKPTSTSMALEDEKELGEDGEDAQGHFEAGFVTLRWAQVRKNSEGPEPEFLAKRRKGLPSAYGAGEIVALSATGESSAMRRAKVKRIDAEGNTAIYDVLAPEGQAVEGEVVGETDIHETVMTGVPAPGTILEGGGIANADRVVTSGDQMMPAPSKRRPPPPKRKAKGPSRGNKRKAMTGEGLSAMNGTNDGLTSGQGDRTLSPEAAKGDNAVANAIAQCDVEVGDESILADGEECSEDDEDGENGSEEGELAESPDTQGSVYRSTTRMPIDRSEQLHRDCSSSPDMPLASGQAGRMPSPQARSKIETAGPCFVEPEPLIQVDAEESTVLAEISLPNASGNIEAGFNTLEGLAMPLVVESTVDQTDDRFPNGDDDLLGSLERHLGVEGGN
ncbi:hypothetical protein MMC09_006582 [Bachmanniomyces sp. S44760]|nr:hypothetical protein [Bachmanniomyces sp. S44760]